MRLKAIEELYEVLDIYDFEKLTSAPLESVEFLKHNFQLPYGFANDVVASYIRKKQYKQMKSEGEREDAFTTPEPLPAFSRKDREMKEIKPKRVDTIDGKIILTFDSQINFN